MKEKELIGWEQGMPITVEKLNGMVGAINAAYSPNNKPTAADIGAEYTRLVDMTSSTYNKDTYYPVVFRFFSQDTQLSEFVITRRAHQDFSGSSNLFLHIQCRPNKAGVVSSYFHMVYTHTYWTNYPYLLGQVLAHEQVGEMVLFLRGGHSYNVVAKGVDSGFLIAPQTGIIAIGEGGTLTVEPFEAGSNYVETGTYESVANNTAITKNECQVLASNNIGTSVKLNGTAAKVNFVLDSSGTLSITAE